MDETEKFNSTKISLRSSSQQPPHIICRKQSAPAVNRTRQVRSVTCALPLGLVAGFLMFILCKTLVV